MIKINLLKAYLISLLLSISLFTVVSAEKYNQNIEQVTYLNNIVDNITLNETSKLAIKLFDDKYFEDVSYIAE